MLTGLKTEIPNNFFRFFEDEFRQLDFRHEFRVGSGATSRAIAARNSIHSSDNGPLSEQKYVDRKFALISIGSDSVCPSFQELNLLGKLKDATALGNFARSDFDRSTRADVSKIKCAPALEDKFWFRKQMVKRGREGLVLGNRLFLISLPLRRGRILQDIGIAGNGTKSYPPTFLREIFRLIMKKQNPKSVFGKKKINQL